MSRIGKKIIKIPNNVVVSTLDKKILVKGKYGSLEKIFSDILILKIENNILSLTRLNNGKLDREYHGLMRALIQNMIIGVNEQFSKNLHLEGVGYKFQIEENFLIINVGFTHPIKFEIPKDLTIKLESNTKLLIRGIDKERVGFFAAKIRGIRPPEPYKGKGIMYEGEKILRKAGKTGKK